MADLRRHDHTPTCPLHPQTPMRCPACMGAKGGRATSPRKTAAVRENGKKGGRPRWKTKPPPA